MTIAKVTLLDSNKIVYVNLDQVTYFDFSSNPTLICFVSGTVLRVVEKQAYFDKYIK